MAQSVPALIDQCETINFDDIEKLIEHAQQGCEESKRKLVEGNTKLVINIVNRFKGREAIHEDLFQIGIIGLMKAIERFDLQRGVRFSTYAVPMIIGEIKRFLRDDSSIRISRSVKDKNRKINHFIEYFISEKGREPLLSEIIKGTGFEKEDVILALSSGRELLSFSQPVNGTDSEDKDLCLEDKIASQSNQINIWIEKECLQQAFEKLGKKEKIVIKMRFYEDKTQMEVGQELGVSQAHISRLEKSAIAKLRKVM